jgi:hypothetical protein
VFPRHNSPKPLKQRFRQVKLQFQRQSRHT